MDQLQTIQALLSKLNSLPSISNAEFRFLPNDVICISITKNSSDIIKTFPSSEAAITFLRDFSQSNGVVVDIESLKLFIAKTPGAKEIVIQPQGGQPLIPLSFSTDGKIITINTTGVPAGPNWETHLSSLALDLQLWIKRCNNAIYKLGVIKNQPYKEVLLEVDQSIPQNESIVSKWISPT